MAAVDIPPVRCFCCCRCDRQALHGRGVWGEVRGEVQSPQGGLLSIVHFPVGSCRHGMFV